MKLLKKGEWEREGPRRITCRGREKQRDGSRKHSTIFESGRDERSQSDPGSRGTGRAEIPEFRKVDRNSESKGQKAIRDTHTRYIYIYIYMIFFRKGRKDERRA